MASHGVSLETIESAIVALQRQELRYIAKAIISQGDDLQYDADLQGRMAYVDNLEEKLYAVRKAKNGESV